MGGGLYVACMLIRVLKSSANPGARETGQKKKKKKKTLNGESAPPGGAGALFKEEARITTGHPGVIRGKAVGGKMGGRGGWKNQGVSA